MMYRGKSQWKAEAPVRKRWAVRTGLISRLTSYWHRRKTIAALRKLGDTRLADLGMTRGQIPSAVDELIASGLTAASLRELIAPRGRS